MTNANKPVSTPGNQGHPPGITVEETSLPGVLLLKPHIFEDHRGEYVELFNLREFRDFCDDLEFVQTDLSVSGRHVLRGFHGDDHTHKLVTCLLGRLYVVVVDCRQDSSNFGRWASFNLTERNRHLVLVPPGHGLAHLTLEEKNYFFYWQTSYYSPTGQFTYRYDDPAFKVWWPVKEPMLSHRDELGHYA